MIYIYIYQWQRVMFNVSGTLLLRTFNKQKKNYKINQIHCITCCKPYLLGHNWQQCRNLCYTIIKKTKVKRVYTRSRVSFAWN